MKITDDGSHLMREDQMPKGMNKDFYSWSRFWTTIFRLQSISWDKLWIVYSTIGIWSGLKIVECLFRVGFFLRFLGLVTQTEGPKKKEEAIKTSSLFWLFNFPLFVEKLSFSLGEVEFYFGPFRSLYSFEGDLIIHLYQGKQKVRLA
ncbi:hypothetical protein PEDI_31490 [Persicobacter diffluens]|uniref:Uncharacterized protein n=1 Tax=Persicobacter diffluens TaxID=981 RepID=A0AAN4W1H9_9BACT|nr:hypothetical protein PEDI_31490 [Persicobacter diffluens]